MSKMRFVKPRKSKAPEPTTKRPFEISIQLNFKSEITPEDLEPKEGGSNHLLGSRIGGWVSFSELTDEHLCEIIKYLARDDWGSDESGVVSAVLDWGVDFGELNIDIDCRWTDGKLSD